MTAPLLTVYQNGVGQLVGDGLNSFNQTCDNTTQLRAFIGVPGVQVYMRGYSTPGDGGQGNFYWNASGTAPDDNGVTTIKPSGATSGEWTRIVAVGTGTVTNIATGAGLTGGPITGTGTISANNNVTHRVITFGVDGGGSAIVAGGIWYLSNIPYNATITGWNIVADQSGSIVIDVWKVNAAVPTVANSITAASLPTLSSSQSIFGGSITGWTTAIAANDVMAFRVNSATTVQKVNLTIGVTVT